MIIKEIENLLTEDDCRTLIDYSKAQLEKLTTIGDNNNYRVGDGTWISSPVMDSSGVDLNKKIKQVVQTHTSLPIENQETIHIVHYGIGGEYKEHHDFFHANVQGHDVHINRGGQRAYSFLFYLNDGFEGGGTKFVKKDITVTPKTGKGLLWSNLTEDGSLDYDSMHSGLPVVSGDKWIAIVWVRQNQFI